MADLSGRPAPSELADATVLDRGGKEHRLGSSWRERPCVVVFLRHFGCIGCDVTVTELTPRLGEIHDAGASTAFIGNGPAVSIEGFVERHALDDKPVAVFTDPSLAAFRAAGLVRSAWATYGVGSVAGYVRALVAGFVPRRTDGDVLQQGGALVIDAGNRVVLHEVSLDIGDHADPSDLVDAVLALAAHTSRIRV